MLKWKRNSSTTQQTSKYDKYANYPAEVVLKRVLKYAWKSKVMIICSLFFLIGFTYLELLQPKLIDRMLDDELLGVQTTWVQTDSGSVLYQDKQYNKIKIEDIDSSDIIISLVYFDGNYYQLEGVASTTFLDYYDKEAHIFVLKDGTTISSSRVSKEQLKAFYQPSIAPITKLLVIYGSLTLLIIILRFFQHVFFLTASMRLTLDIRKDAFAKLNRLPMGYFVAEPSGKIVTKITSDSEGVRGYIKLFFPF